MSAPRARSTALAPSRARTAISIDKHLFIHSKHRVHARVSTHFFIARTDARSARVRRLEPPADARARSRRGCARDRSTTRRTSFVERATTTRTRRRRARPRARERRSSDSFRAGERSRTSNARDARSRVARSWSGVESSSATFARVGASPRRFKGIARRRYRTRSRRGGTPRRPGGDDDARSTRTSSDGVVAARE